VEERAILRSERLGDLPALFDADVRDPPLLEGRRDRATDPAEADDDGVVGRRFLAAAANEVGGSVLAEVVDRVIRPLGRCPLFQVRSALELLLARPCRR